ncbi:hypothetical protein SAMN05216474_0748 [Lishizhenia tianjinensis]|uniref:Outer membrane protein beta-barrel domain-containing protein n=2 Tax=Lishizhenia tianjinensis TaxID=477690 RepID=A0A1I6Y9Q5_9FLAO|nr:hypothetical protein SAMN05216474_0748 [Lishizhenia tianjinensis]
MAPTTYGQYPLIKKRRTSISRINVHELYPFGTITFKGKTQTGTQKNYVVEGYMGGVGYSYVSAQKFKKIGFGFAIEPQYNNILSDALYGTPVRLQDVKLPLMFKISNENDAEFGIYPFFNSFSLGAYTSRNLAITPEQAMNTWDYGLSAALEFGLFYLDLKFNYFYSLKPLKDTNADGYTRQQVFAFGLMLPLRLNKK